MEKLFFELMQVAVGQLDCLSRGPSPEEWAELYQMAKRQAVTGICYSGVEKLFEFGLRALAVWRNCLNSDCVLHRMSALTGCLRQRRYA